MVVQHNITSMNANRNLSVVGNRLAKASEKLSSGYRINRAADDAAGLAISEKLRAEVRGLQRASKNAQDGISAIQTVEGVMDAMHEIAQRARELKVQQSTDQKLTDRAKISTELAQLASEFQKIGSQVQFNKNKVNTLNSLTLQVGAYGNETMAVSTTFPSSLDKSSIATIDNAISTLSTARSNLGAIQNRLEFRVKALDNAAENVSSAESRIRDTDMADEMTRFSKENILQQAATSMLAQANQANQGVLSLLQ